MSTRSARERAALALRRRLEAIVPTAIGDDGYAVTTEANLLVPMTLEVQRAFEAGAGQELRTKMRAPHSSSALAFNAFAPWISECSDLALAGFRGFDLLAFEKVYPTGLVGSPPHLDVLAERADALVAIESKCLEYLTPKVVSFSESYRGITDARASSRWFLHLQSPTDQQARHLDVAQLVKHFLGLSREYPSREVVLLYLYWEPENWRDVAECVNHRAELEEFAYSVAGDPVRFASLSYPALWRHWYELRQGPSWLPQHLARLSARYGVSV